MIQFQYFQVHQAADLGRQQSAQVVVAQVEFMQTDQPTDLGRDRPEQAVLRPAACDTKIAIRNNIVIELELLEDYR